MLLNKLSTGEIINLDNVASIKVDDKGSLGIRYILVNDKVFVEPFSTVEELNARLENLMSTNTAITIEDYDVALETAKEIQGKE